MRIISFMACLWFCLGPITSGVGLGNMQQQSERVVSVHDEPFHKTVLQNQYVRVMDVEIPPHQATLFHMHKAPLVGVVIHEEPNWEQIYGETRQGTTKDPNRSLIDNSGQKLPYTHRVGNEGNAPIHYLAAEWLASPNGSAPVLMDGVVRKLEKDVPKARFYRVKLPPGGTGTGKGSVAPGLLIVFAGAAQIHAEGIQLQPVRGDGALWGWRDAGASYSIDNLGKKELEIVEIDWK